MNVSKILVDAMTRCFSEILVVGVNEQGACVYSSSSARSAMLLAKIAEREALEAFDSGRELKGEVAA